MIPDIPRPSVREFLRVKADPATKCAREQCGVKLRRQAAALKPAMDRHHFKARVRRKCVLVNRPPGRPTVENIGCGDFSLHDRHNMTNLVIRQRGQHGD